MWPKIKNNFVWLLLAVLALTAVFVWWRILEAAPEEKTRIDFFDIGQGSAILISAPNQNQVLIDGGPSDAILAKLGRTLPLFDEKIELLILTHPDSDHLSGLVEVLKRYEVGEILETGILDDSAEYREWNNLIKQKNVPVVFARAGQTVKIADNLKIDILYPLGQIAGQDFGDDTNRTSVVGKIIYGENEILFTGDAEKTAENSLIFAGVDLRADILVVGHHGSKTSTGENFLAAVAPRAAVIQAGRNNRYGHPSNETLERLKGLDVWRTDLDGDIMLRCDLAECALAP
ncbi:MAG: ComEC/Rec2 family competence protein [Candidatus Portnoybacteria bacterium]|jgi:competence protein ComEC|nr:ComEC/Rec2 family competence protein [Candidatus Portnoybacteria bacterium]